ncbi:PREDICTED: uncharacterized protein LOC109592464 [Amphimedon queenslandica]|uniref:Uncharacterized protein n=1 Tax=Amphimedon queenslandica TaxID=400682 RepID=A0AAN0K1Q3_AMPQE|nr:PREDICTED: uncharacterized protein LOC109592464 [Amphimedon queenslandica]|eukprot:XP_019863459.1 PREDICTED: uncharacterized protein LOC109592464 [Amphimedon queenslandica]
MLTQEAVSRVVSASPSIPNQREALLTAVKGAVQTDPNSLHTFANVLCTISTNVSLGQTILDDISRYFPAPDDHDLPAHVVPHAEALIPVHKDLLMSFISSKSLPLEEIKEFMSFCCSTENLRKKVKQCTDISAVLHLIQDECSLTDIKLLCSVVKEMKVAEATECIETYEMELKEFCKSLSISLSLKKKV